MISRKKATRRTKGRSPAPALALEYDFKLFLAMWGEINSFHIPNVHAEIADFLDDGNWGTTQSKVLLLPRGIGKTYAVNLWVAYKLSKDPTLRFVIAFATSDLAVESVREIRTVIREHPLCKHLANKTPGFTDRADRFFVEGHKYARNPSVRAIGLQSNFVGGRSDILILDDVEIDIKGAGRTDKDRKIVRSKIAELSRTLDKKSVNSGFRVLCGTYWDTISVYDEEYRAGASRLKLSLLKNPTGLFPHIKGQSIWPEIFSESRVLELQQVECKSVAEFRSQYLLEPIQIKDAYLDPTLLRVYDTEPQFHLSGGRYIATLEGRRIVSVSAVFDPTSGRKDGDVAVFGFAFTDYEGHIYIHRMIPVLQRDPDDISDQVVELAKNYNIPVIGIEANGVGAALVQLIEKRAVTHGIGVDAFHTSKNKTLKIIEAYETPLYGGYLHVHESVYASPFLQQLTDFSPSINLKNNNFADDYIDVGAMCLEREPVLIGLFGNPEVVPIADWMGMGPVQLTREKAKL